MNMQYLEKMFNVKDKIIVITGGLGLLGTEYAVTILNSGAKIVVLDNKELSAEHELKKYESNDNFKFYQVSILERVSVEKILKDITDSWGVPSVLINNAALDFIPGKSAAAESFEDYSLEKWNAVLAVNLTGMLICCQVFGGAMAKNKGGSIINISSTYGLVSPDQRIYNNFIKPVSYSVTKSGVLNLTRYLATYWGDKNVRVNTLSPGGVFNNQDSSFVEKYNNKVPLKRMARKDEYNGAILFLASDASSYMTGANLIIDGGWTAW